MPPSDRLPITPITLSSYPIIAALRMLPLWLASSMQSSRKCMVTRMPYPLWQSVNFFDDSDSIVLFYGRRGMRQTRFFERLSGTISVMHTCYSWVLLHCVDRHH
jgi:hypothetical protein